MTTTKYNPLSDMNQIKERLAAMFGLDESITRLVVPAVETPAVLEQTPVDWFGTHCFDTSYLEGSITEGGCAIYIDTNLTAVSNPYVREVRVEISVICHKNAVTLSEEERTFCNSIGIYGNRIDCLCQLIHASILSHPAMKEFQKDYATSPVNLTKADPVRSLKPEPGYYGKTLAYTYHTACQAKSGNNVGTAGKG